MITSSHDWNLKEQRAVWDAGSIDPSRLLFWSWYEPRNFGDWIGPFLYEGMTGRRPHFCPKRRMRLRGCTMSVGSILRHIACDDSVVVWGSGIISSEDVFKRPKKVLAVRGPLTRDRCHQLGYECPQTYGDPAILLPQVYKVDVTRRPGRVGLIPHYFDTNVFHSDSDNLCIIDVTRPVHTVIDSIASCSVTFSSSLHGIIVSHAYGVPCVWIRSINPLIGDDSKFRDYFLSVGIDPSPVEPKSYDIELLAALEGYATLPSHGPLLDPLLQSCPLVSQAQL